MADEKLTKRFTLDASDKPVIRDKDNAMPRIKPPQMAKTPQPNLAPPVMSGLKVRPGYVLGKPDVEKPRKNYSLDRNGDLTKEFKPIARKLSEPDHER